MAINFERLVSRDLAVKLSRTMDLAGVKSSVNKVLSIMIIPGIVLFVAVSFLVYQVFSQSPFLSVLVGVLSWGVLIAIVYMMLQYRIDSRKNRMEALLPDYFMLTAANLRSGIALDRAMLLAARPEFGFFSDDVKEMGRRLFSGETLEESLLGLSNRYRSVQLQHSVRMMVESIRYGGAMADLMYQISKDVRSQQLAQKEISGQMLMYTIFVAFAGLVAAPALYGLTSQMIAMTEKIWAGIQQQGIGTGTSQSISMGVSFLKPSAPKITTGQYQNFSLVSIVVITGCASLIMASIS